jgi:hypothetical protein
MLADLHRKHANSHSNPDTYAHLDTDSNTNAHSHAYTNSDSNILYYI